MNGLKNVLAHTTALNELKNALHAMRQLRREGKDKLDLAYLAQKEKAIAAMQRLEREGYKEEQIKRLLYAVYAPSYMIPDSLQEQP
jgi:hypothetical protein